MHDPNKVLSTSKQGESFQLSIIKDGLIKKIVYELDYLQ